MTNNDGYRWLIDELVKVAQTEVTAERIRAHGHPARKNLELNAVRNNDKIGGKDPFLIMSPEQREVIAKMLEGARASAIHDVACFLDECIDDRRMSVIINGSKLSESPYGSYHYDFTCRLEGDTWPDQE